MTDVLAPVVPYARFLEVRARRLDIVAERGQPNQQAGTDGAVSSEPIADNEQRAVAVRVLATDPAGAQRS